MESRFVRNSLPNGKKFRTANGPAIHRSKSKRLRAHGTISWFTDRTNLEFILRHLTNSPDTRSLTVGSERSPKPVETCWDFQKHKKQYIYFWHIVIWRKFFHYFLISISTIVSSDSTMEGISPNSDQFCSCCLWKQKELRLEDGSSTAKQTKSDKNQTQSRFFGHSGDVRPTKSTSHRNCKWLFS